MPVLDEDTVAWLRKRLRDLRVSNNQELAVLAEILDDLIIDLAKEGGA